MTIYAVPEIETRRDALVERLFNATLGAFDLYAVYLGDRLGLYRALASCGALTSGELAAAAGIAERYAREWLEQQAVAGILDVSDDRFSLPPGHDEALIDEASLAFAARPRGSPRRSRGRCPTWSRRRARGGLVLGAG